MVIFHFNGFNCRQPGSCPTGFHYYFDYVAETSFTFETVDSLLATNSSCEITRGGSGDYRAFFGINNFLELPDINSAIVTNTMEFITDRVSACTTFQGLDYVSFLYVDFWNQGQVMEFVMNYNTNLGWKNVTDLSESSSTSDIAP